jgi:CRISPR-associated protein Csm2
MIVFQFEIRQLGNIIKNAKDRQKQQDFLERKYRDWGIEQSDSVTVDQGMLRQIINPQKEQEEEAARILVQTADRLGAIFKATGLSSSQIRSVFGEVRAIQQQGFDDPSTRRRFILLIPKLEYARGRAKTFSVDSLNNVLGTSIRLVEDDSTRFKRFVEFFEAILAYHKAYGGN